MKLLSGIALAIGVSLIVNAQIVEDGLLLHFDASDAGTLKLDGGQVAEWASKTSPRLVATTDPTRRPVFQKSAGGTQRPVLHFDGIDDVLRVPLTAKVDTWTLVMVAAVERPVAGGALGSAAPTGGNDYDPGFTVDLYGAAQALDQLSVEGAGRIGGQRDQLERSYPAGGLHVIVVSRKSDRVDLFIDGRFEGARPVMPAQTVMETFRIGARFFDGQERLYFHGAMAQVLLYGRALDDAERARVEDALKVSAEERDAGERLAREMQSKPRMVAPKVIESWPAVEAFVTAKGEALNPQKLPIRRDLREAIELGSIHLNSLFDADRDNEPFFFINREADGTGKMRHSVEIGIPHVVGRCLLGSMMAGKYAGIPFPEKGLPILERYCKSSFDNPDHLNSYYDPNKNNGRFVEFHNMREGLYGLWALIDGRHAGWARETAHQMLETLDKITDAEGNWSPALAKEAGMADHCFGLAPPNAGRIVDALLAYYDVTQDPLAMKLAGLYTRRGMKALYTDDGHFAPMEQSSGHVHSITSSLSGFTEYAVRTHDDALLAHCRRVMDVGIPEYFSSWGWGDEVFPDHPANVIGRGEINQTGDVVRTGLILGDAGYPEYYETAERFLRSMLLPTQHREPELRKILKDRATPADDSERDTVKRSIGGFAMQLPNDRMRAGDWPISTLDITSGAVHAMSECYRHRTTVRDGVYRVNLLLDFRDDAIDLDSLLPFTGRITFGINKDIQGISIRIPRWIDPKSLKANIDNKEEPFTIRDGYLVLEALPMGAVGFVAFDLPVKTEKETVDGTEYTTTWVGNQLVDILPRGTESPLPF